MKTRNDGRTGNLAEHRMRRGSEQQSFEGAMALAADNQQARGGRICEQCFRRSHAGFEDLVDRKVGIGIRQTRNCFRQDHALLFGNEFGVVTGGMPRLTTGSGKWKACSTVSSWPVRSASAAANATACVDSSEPSTPTRTPCRFDMSCSPMTATGHWATVATCKARSVREPPTQPCPEPTTTMEAFLDFLPRA